MAYAAPVPSAPPQNSSGAIPNFIEKGYVKFIGTNPFPQTWIVPSGVTGIECIINGGIGAYGYSYSNDYIIPSPGAGGNYTAYAPVNPGDQITVWVGMNAGDWVGGWGYINGSNGWTNGYSYAGGGGGASAVAVNGNIIGIAGGGGGAEGYGYGGGGGFGCGGAGGSQYGGAGGGCNGTSVGSSGINGTDTSAANNLPMPTVYIFYN